MIKTLREITLQFRWLSLALAAVITVFAVAQLNNLQIDNSNEAFFNTQDKTKERQDAFKETFGNDDFIFILLDTETEFDVDTIQSIGELAERLELEVPHLLSMTWIGNVEKITSVPDGINIDELLPSLQLESDELRRRLKEAANDKAYRDALIAGDGRSLGILLEFENYPEIGIDPRKDTSPAINKILADFDHLTIYAVGGPMMDYMMDQRTAIEAPTWLITALVGMCLLLAITTRSLLGVIVPAVTVVLSVIWTMAAVSLIGYKLNLFAILVPTLMLCVGIGDTMHVVAEFQQLRREGLSRFEALRTTLSLVSGPILLTTITTATGFLAFLATDLVPIQELGVQAAIGVWMALLLTYLFAVPLLTLGFSEAKTDQPKEPGLDIFDRLLAWLTDVVIANPAKIFAGFVIAALLSFIGINKLVIETNTIEDLPKDDPLRAAFEYVDDRMGGSLAIELVVDTHRPDGIKDLALLKKVEKLQAMLNEHPLVNQTDSILDQLKQLHRALRNDDPDQYRLPNSNSQVSEYLLLYESGGGQQMEKFVSFTYDQLRVQVRTRTINLGQIRVLQKAVDDFVAQEFDDSVTVYSAGTMPMFERIGTLIAEGQRNSFILAFIAITIVMILMLRSVKLGMIAMIPNVLPVAFTLGAMGWVGAHLNMVGMVLAPMIIGVAVDDTVHFFVRYRRYFLETLDYDKAYRKTISTVGRPLLFTTLVLVAGFSGFLMSIFAGPRNFAWSSMLAFSSAILAEFMLVPVLLKWLKPFKSSKSVEQQLQTAS